MYVVKYNFNFGDMKEKKCVNVDDVEAFVEWINEQVRNGNYKDSYYECETLPDEIKEV